MSSSLPSISSLLPSYLSDPYLNSEGPSVMVNDRTKHRFDPYASTSADPLDEFFPNRCTGPSTSNSTTVPSQSTTVASTPGSTAVPALPTAAPAATLKKGRKNAKDLIRPKEDYGPFDPDRVLPEDPKMRGLRDNDKKICWYFLLTLLMDPSKKHVVAWTGRGREFINVQGFARTIKIDSFRRNLRSCYKKRILIPVDAQANRFAFHTEPSVHVGMTREQLTEFITAHSLAAPASLQSVADATMTYPTPPSSTEPQFDKFIPSPYPLIPEYRMIPSSSSTVSLPVPTVISTYQPPACQFAPLIDQSHSQPTLTDLPIPPYWSPPPMTNFYPNATQFPGQYYAPGSNVDYYGHYY